MTEQKEKQKGKISLTTATLIGLALGILVGIFFGEPAQVLRPIGTAYISLLQMAVLPYFLVALIYGLGRLSFGEAKMLGIYAAGILAALWAFCLIVVVAMSFAFPEYEAASFFSTSLIEAKKTIDFISLYIPANPFNALAKAVIPAVVVFGVAFGIALIGIKEKENLLKILSTLSDCLTRITQFIVKLTPIGVFALAAVAAGTMDIEQAARLQVYLVTYGVGALLLTFLVVPMFISSLTPFGYREVLAASKDAMVTGFTTGNLLVVLPMLAESCKRLFATRDFSGKKAESTVDVIIPLSFPFPDIGTLLILLFIPFAAWFSGNALELSKYPAFLGVGFFSFFGNVEIGMPFLLDQLQIPSDMFQLHVMTLVYVGRFATMLAVMHVTAVALMASCAMNGLLTIKWRNIIRQFGFSLVFLLVSVAGSRLMFHYTFDPEYKGYQTIIEMDYLYPETKSVKVYKEKLPPSLKIDPEKSRLEQIRTRGFIRVGYFKDALPFVFTNASAKLVGFDVEMAHRLAKELQVNLEFVKIKRSELATMLDEGYCDIIMCGVGVTLGRMSQVYFSAPYLDQTLAFMVEDHRRHEFGSRDALKEKEELNLGSIDLPYVIRRFKEYLPQAKITILESPREFFTKKNPDIDALIITAEAGSAWSLVYPNFSAAIPHPDVFSIPMAYALPQGDQEMVNFIDAWVLLKKKDKTVARLFDHWFLGKNIASQKQRWSIIRDVLHWVD